MTRRLRLRRFAAALLGLLLLQTSALDGRLACLMPAAAGSVATGPVQGGGGADPAADDAGRHAGHHLHADPAPAGTDGASRGGERGQRPHGTQQHCPSATSCTAVAIAAFTTSAGDGPVQVAARIVAPRATTPASVVRGPEPPPPRA